MNELGSFRCTGFPTFRAAGLIVACFVCASAAALEGTLLVANRAGGSISFFDLATRVEIARLPVGPIVPHEVAVSPDGRWALTSEYGPNDQPGRHLIVIDVRGARISGRIDLGPASRPHSMMFLPDNRRAVSTMQDSDRVALVDVATLEVLRIYATGGREGHMVRLSPDARRAYVTNRGAEGSLSVIFLDEDRPPAVIRTGAGAEGVAVSPDGREVWVANQREETISIIDAETLEKVATIGSRRFVGRAENGPAGRVVVSNGTTSQAVPQYLRVYDRAARTVLEEIPLRDGGPQLGIFGLLIHEGLAIVSDPSEGIIKIFDLHAMGEPDVLVTGHEAPDGMGWSPLRVDAME